MMNDSFSDSDKILFISDVHLGGFSSEKNARLEVDLLALVDYAKKNDYQIAVLGDLFDYWMEYKNYVPPYGERILNRFAVFNKNNRTLYITGNHDNWTRGYFEKMGFDVEPDYRLLSIGNKKVLLLHGDAVGEDLEHLKRPLLHRILRHPYFVKLYQTIYWIPQKGVRVMKYYSRFTNFLAGKPDSRLLNKWSKKILHTTDVDVIICGHDHVPRVNKFSYGTYLNLGTFYHHKTLVIYNNNQFRLVCWNSDSNELIPFHS